MHFNPITLTTLLLITGAFGRNLRGQSEVTNLKEIRDRIKHLNEKVDRLSDLSKEDNFEEDEYAVLKPVQDDVEDDNLEDYQVLKADLKDLKDKIKYLHLHEIKLIFHKFSSSSDSISEEDNSEEDEYIAPQAVQDGVEEDKVEENQVVSYEDKIETIQNKIDILKNEIELEENLEKEDSVEEDKVEEEDDVEEDKLDEDESRIELLKEIVDKYSTLNEIINNKEEKEDKVEEDSVEEDKVEDSVGENEEEQEDSALNNFKEIMDEHTLEDVETEDEEMEDEGKQMAAKEMEDYEREEKLNSLKEHLRNTIIKVDLENEEDDFS